MKQAFSILLISVILGYQILPTLIFIDFKVHQEFIANVLCINKEEPQKGCNGQCHLKKSIEKSTPTEKPEKQNQKTYRELTQITPSEAFPFYLTNNESEIRLIKYQQTFPRTIYLDGIFHPPQTFVL